MKQDLETLYRTNPLKACKLALRRTVRAPWKDRLEQINRLLAAYGTEAIRGEWQNGYWCDVVAAYVNMGDTYELTVLHVRGDGRDPRGRFIVSSWGDFVERNETRLQIQ